MILNVSHTGSVLLADHVKRQLTRTFSSSLFKSFPTTERHCTPPQATPEDFGSEMIDLVSWHQSMDSQKSLFCKYGPCKRLNELILLWLLGNSSGDNHACHFCRLCHTLRESVTLFIAFSGSETLACYFSCSFSSKNSLITIWKL